MIGKIKKNKKAAVVFFKFCAIFTLLSAFFCFSNNINFIGVFLVLTSFLHLFFGYALSQKQKT
jgi:hypothetical protein